MLGVDVPYMRIPQVTSESDTIYSLHRGLHLIIARIACAAWVCNIDHCQCTWTRLVYVSSILNKTEAAYRHASQNEMQFRAQGYTCCSEPDE